MTKLQSGNKIIIEGNEQSNIFPQNREEVLKEFSLDGRNKPFDIKGGVYSNNLTIIGPGVIKGPVFSSENIRLEIIRKGTLQRFLSGLTSYKTIVTNVAEDTAIEQSPAAKPEGIKFIVRGDIVATEKVHLKNCLVVGSIHSPSIEIENCIILGTIFAKGTPGFFRASCSTFGIFETNQLQIEGPTTLLKAGGICTSEPIIKDVKTNSGEQYSFSIRLLSLCRTKNVGCGIPNTIPDFVKDLKTDTQILDRPGMSCVYWLKNICPFKSSIELSKTDFIKLFYEEENNDKIKLSSIGQNEYIDEKNIKWIFGLQNRGADLKQVKEFESNFNQILHGVFAFEHLEPNDRENIKTMWKDKLSLNEQLLLNLATDGLETRF